jgi:hypothetical protein
MQHDTDRIESVTLTTRQQHSEKRKPLLCCIWQWLKSVANGFRSIGFLIEDGR